MPAPENLPMNESPTLPPPFDPRPFEPAATKPASGCQRPLLIGCGLVALLLGIGAIVFLMKAKDVLAFAMNQLRAQVVAQLPENLPAEERRELEAGFDRAIERIRRGAIDPAALQDLQRKLTAAAQEASSRRMTRDEVAGLRQALDAFNEEKAGENPAGDAAPPAAAAPPDS